MNEWMDVTEHPITGFSVCRGKITMVRRIHETIDKKGEWGEKAKKK